jgi:hypothetical protein
MILNKVMLIVGKDYFQLNDIYSDYYVSLEITDEILSRVKDEKYVIVLVIITM